MHFDCAHDIVDVLLHNRSQAACIVSAFYALFMHRIRSESRETIHDKKKQKQITVKTRIVSQDNKIVVGALN